MIKNAVSWMFRLLVRLKPAEPEGAAFIAAEKARVNQELDRRIAAARDAEDAQRYRWLRRRTVIHHCMGKQTKLGRLSTLDAAIDAAIGKR